MSYEFLLSGLIGALIATLLSILYQEFRDKKEKNYLLAKERLNKIYGPLMLIYNSNKNLNKNLLFTEAEIKKIDEIIFNNYSLIEEKRKIPLINLYSHNKFSEKARGEYIIEAIKSGYRENKKRII